MSRVLITGATGMLGSHLMPCLQANGWQPVGLGRSPSGLSLLRSQGYETVQADISAPLPDLGRFDAIVHCAALSQPFGPLQAFQRANVDGTKHVIDAARRAGVRRFVHISSPTLYFAFQDQLDVRETAPLPPPVNAYAATKYIAEKRVLAASDLSPIILRPRGIYGKGDTSLLPRLLRAAQKGPLPLLRGGRAKIDLTHVSDVCNAVRISLLADPKLSNHVYNISSGEVLPIRHIANEAARLAGQTVRWRKMPFWPLLQVARLAETVAALHPKKPEPYITAYALGLFAYEQGLNIDKAKHQLGWFPQISFSDGLSRTFDAV